MAAAAVDRHFPATPSPEHRITFAPPNQAERYQFFVTPAPIDEVAAFYVERTPQGPADHFVVRPGAPDAFDNLAQFSRSKLARLYKGRAPRLARGPIMASKGSPDLEAVALLMSPYPEPDLSGLNSGTLIMLVSVNRALNTDHFQP